MIACFTILGDPRTKGNSGVIVLTKRGRRKLLPSPKYRAWLKGALWQAIVIRAQTGINKPIEERCTVSATFYRTRLCGDEDNHKKALGDYLQAARIVANDRLIHWGEVRIERDKVRPRIDVRIESEGADHVK